MKIDALAAPPDAGFKTRFVSWAILVLLLTGALVEGISGGVSAAYRGRVRAFHAAWVKVRYLAWDRYNLPEDAADPERLAAALGVNKTLYHRYDKLIGWAGAQNRLDPDLIRAVILVESRFNAAAISQRGARGLMQLMPATALSLGVADAFDPLENVLAGAKYLRTLLAMFDENMELALAAYDAGPKPVKDRGAIPEYPETKHYVASVLAAYRILKNARS